MQEELAEMYFTPDKSRQREVGPGREGVWPGEGGLRVDRESRGDCCEVCEWMSSVSEVP